MTPKQTPTLSAQAEQPRYTRATVITAEGARVALVTCLRCGASLLLDPREGVSVMEIHDRWHGGRP